MTRQVNGDAVVRPAPQGSTVDLNTSFYSRSTEEGDVQSEKVWSALVQTNPIDVADQEIQDEYVKYVFSSC